MRPSRRIAPAAAWRAPRWAGSRWELARARTAQAAAGEGGRDVVEQGRDRPRPHREGAREGRRERGGGVGERRQEEGSQAAGGEPPRRRLGHGLGDDDVGRERQVRPVGLDGAHRQQRHRPGAVAPGDRRDLGDLRPGRLLPAQDLPGLGVGGDSGGSTAHGSLASAMIVYDEGPTLALITQPDHAHFSGELLSLWRADGLPATPRRAGAPLRRPRARQRLARGRRRPPLGPRAGPPVRLHRHPARAAHRDLAAGDGALRGVSPLRRPAHRPPRRRPSTATAGASRSGTSFSAYLDELEAGLAAETGAGRGGARGRLPAARSRRSGLARRLQPLARALRAATASPAGSPTARSASIPSPWPARPPFGSPAAASLTAPTEATPTSAASSPRRAGSELGVRVAPCQPEPPVGRPSTRHTICSKTRR